MDTLLAYDNDEHQNTFLNTLRDGVILLSDKHTVLFANVSAQHMLGLSEKQLLDKHFEDTVQLQADGKQISGSQSPVVKAHEKNGIYSSQSDKDVKLTMARADRSMLSVKMTVLPSNSSSSNVAFIVIFHDSSADEKIDQAKSEFIALVSHQLRTPVNIISWYVEKLMNEKHGNLNSSQATYLDEVVKSNKRVTDLVQAIVNVSRTDLNRLKHKHEAVDLVDILKRTVAEIKPIAQSKNISLSTHFDNDTTTLNDSDQELISTSVKNVLLNAVRYTQDGGGVKVTLHSLNATKELISKSGQVIEKSGYIISVSDNGIGIPDEEKQQIFNKLYRASNVQTLDVTGVGLGLYIAQNFMQELGGQIWFDSEVRDGATFYLFVPKE